ncbi:zf-HC2 domain-containing protein [Streptosporangium sp. CA-135522]|uniref:zf-HC2 domain-containing protein n=1 Tax=Streptosporangium sp. CA-135522 TaxID=3240072 RepID=UPI003D9044BB
MMMTTCDEVRISLGAYALGALEPEECVFVEAHLAECDACRAEFEELSGVAAFLGRVSEADVAQVSSPPQAVLDRLLSARVKRRRMTRALLSLAASVLLIGLGGTLWSTTQSTPPAQEATTAAAPQSSAADDSGGAFLKEKAVPSAGPDSEARLLRESAGERTAEGGDAPVHATVTAIPGEKATTVKVMLTGVAKGTRCRLEVVGVDGSRETAGNWIVDRAAYDKSGAFNGTTTLPPGSIAKAEIMTARGRMLASVDFP